MELLVKVLVATVIVIIVLGAAFYALRGVFAPQVTQAQAQSLVLSDLQNANPGAMLNITNSTPSQFAGSWHIVVSVVTNATSPCPGYFIYAFDYPKYRFVYTVVNTYTSGCNIYESSVNGTYIISSYPVAVTKATTLNIPQVDGYIGEYGFGNVTTHAAYFGTTVISGTKYNGTWEVQYSAPKANYSVYTWITKSGSEITTYNQSK